MLLLMQIRLLLKVSSSFHNLTPMRRNSLRPYTHLASFPVFSSILFYLKCIGHKGERVPAYAIAEKPGDAPAQRSVVVTTGGAPPAGGREGQHRSAEGEQHSSQVARCAWPLARDLAPASLHCGRTAASTGELTHRQRVSYDYQKELEKCGSIDWRADS